MGSRCRCATVDAPLARGWRWRGVDAGAVPHNGACREVSDRAIGRGPDISGREGEGGTGEAGPSWATACWAGSLMGERSGKRKGWVAAAGQKGGRGANEPKWLFLFFNSLFYFLSLICICLNDLKFKFECMSV